MWLVFILVTTILISLVRAHHDEQHNHTIVMRQEGEAIQDELRVNTEWDNMKLQYEERKANQEIQLNRERARREQDKNQKMHEKSVEKQTIENDELKIDKLREEFAKTCSSLDQRNEEQVRLTNERYRMDTDVDQKTHDRRHEQSKEDNRVHLAFMGNLSKDMRESEKSGRATREGLLQQRAVTLSKRLAEIRDKE